MEIKSKQDLLMHSINLYYKNNPNKLNELIKILTGSYEIKDGSYKGIYNISLRLIDWFVTNFSKKNNISYLLTNNEKEIISKNENFTVYLNYKSQLKSYSKKQFDPFCRRNRIKFYYKNNEYFETTVGQLNFFRWALQNNIIEYIVKNYKIIENDMNTNVNYKYDKKPQNHTGLNANIEKNDKQTPSSRKKRKELSISATKFLNKHDITILLKFD